MHTAEQLALAGYHLIGCIIDELEASSPGTRARIMARSRASLDAAPHTPNILKMREILAELPRA